MWEDFTYIGRLPTTGKTVVSNMGMVICSLDVLAFLIMDMHDP
jgi:hypothetical protein